MMAPKIEIDVHEKDYSTVKELTTIFVAFTLYGVLTVVSIK